MLNSPGIFPGSFGHRSTSLDRTHMCYIFWMRCSFFFFFCLSEEMQRSLPNLSRAHSVPIVYLLRTSQSFDSPGCSTLLQPSSKLIAHLRFGSNSQLSAVLLSYIVHMYNRYYTDYHMCYPLFNIYILYCDSVGTVFQV